jgi:transcription initiation factor IIE alpha subunit
VTEALFQRDEYSGAWRVPCQRHSPTSRQAAESVRPHLGALQQRVLDFIRDRGGATDNEIIAGTGLSGSTVRPRRIELVQRGLVVDCGETRATETGRKAVVWRAA